MSLTPPLRNPGDDQPVMPRPRGPETGVYIARVYHGEGDAIVDFVLSLNMVRRHLSINQKLAAAHKAMPMYREQAKQRRLATLKRGEEMPVSANWREREEGKAAHHVANLFGVSPRAVERTEAVYRDGAPELVQAFESDEVSVSAAAEVATLPDDEQREVVAAGPDAMKNAAKAVRDDYATACGLTRSRVGKWLRQLAHPLHNPTRKWRTGGSREWTPQPLSF